MKQTFDNKFGQQIKEVFKNRQEPYNSEDWEKLKAKKAKDRDRIIFWWFDTSVAVALILILIGGLLGGLMLYNTFENKNTLMNDSEEFIIVDSNSNNKTDTDNTDSVNQDSFKKPMYNPSEQKTENSDHQGRDDITKTDDNNYKKSKKDEETNLLLQVKNNHNTIVQKKEANKRNAVVFNAQNNALLSEESLNPKLQKESVEVAFNKKYNISTTDSKLFVTKKKEQHTDLVKANKKEFMQDEPFQKEDVQKQETWIVNANKTTFSDSLSRKDINSLIRTPKEKKVKNNSVTFGLTVSPNVNYDQTSQNTDVNIGGGILLEIPIFTNLDVYTGLLITNQKINFQENTLQTVASGTQLKSKKAVLIGLDLPINLKYNFSINKNHMFITIGLSSITYLKESIESTFQVSNAILTESTDELGNPILVSDILNTIETETETRGSFNNFHLGKIINLSFGVELPFKKDRQSLIVEPYFKYSLEPLTSENLDLSSAGINLKLNFNSKKKSK